MIQKNPDTEDVIYDKKGKDNAIRVAVPIEETIDLSNIFDRKKSLLQKEKDTKDMSEEQISAQKKRLMADHDKHINEDSVGIGSLMVRSSSSNVAGNCFSSQAMDMDIEEMAQRQDDAQSDQSENEIEEPQRKSRKKTEKVTETKDTKSKKNKTAWFDRDTSIASHIRTETTALCGIGIQIDSKLHDAQAVLEEVEKRGKQCEEEVKMEKSTVNRRLEFLNAVKCIDAKKLQTLQEQCTSSQQDPPGDNVDKTDRTESDSQETDWTAQMSKAPPCTLVLDWVEQSILFSIFQHHMGNN